MGIIGLITQKGNPSKLPYINKDCTYEISPYYWQFIVAERMSSKKRYWQWHQGDRYTLGRLRELGQLK